MSRAVGASVAAPGPGPEAPASFTVAPGGALVGRCVVPGDKSISQRAALLAALAACGVAWRLDAGGALLVTGRGEWAAPAAPLDLANSGTALRLLAGALAGQPVAATLTGDASLSRRPMERVAAPLRAMGAAVTTTDGRPPVAVRGRRPLAGIEWSPEVASAQVKSAVLIAGLAARGEVAVREPVPTRDHTERMLGGFGVDCLRDGGRVVLGRARSLRATTVVVPGDASSAAFLVIGAAMTPGSELTVEGVGLNPTRTAFLEVLRAMGADLAVEVTSDPLEPEPFGRIAVRGRALAATAIAGRLALQAMDELPMLLVAAATADGVTRLADAAELRHKESDRLACTAAGLAALGIEVAPADDGLTVVGRPAGFADAPGGTRLDAHHDHRLAMAFALAALRARGPLTVTRAEAIATSFPGFHPVARGLGLALETTA